VIMKRAGHVSARMSDHYTHISEQAERREFERLRAPHRPPPVPSAGPDIMHPAIQAEIARQVSIAMALREHEQKQSRPRLVVFPGNGVVRAIVRPKRSLTSSRRKRGEIACAFPTNRYSSEASCKRNSISHDTGQFLWGGLPADTTRRLAYDF
jgi:hypothetical protein